jgi:hypothetical protein
MEQFTVSVSLDFLSKNSFSTALIPLRRFLDITHKIPITIWIKPDNVECKIIDYNHDDMLYEIIQLYLKYYKLNCNYREIQEKIIKHFEKKYPSQIWNCIITTDMEKKPTEKFLINIIDITLHGDHIIVYSKY